MSLETKGRKSYYIPFKIPRHVYKLLPKVSAATSTEQTEDTVEKWPLPTPGKLNADKDSCIGCEGMKSFNIKTARIHNVQKRQMRDLKRQAVSKKARKPKVGKKKGTSPRGNNNKKKRAPKAQKLLASSAGTTRSSVKKFRNELKRGVAEYRLRSKLKDEDKHLSVGISPNEEKKVSGAGQEQVKAGGADTQPTLLAAADQPPAAAAASGQDQALAVGKPPAGGAVTITYEDGSAEEAEDVKAIESMRRDVRTILDKLPAKNKGEQLVFRRKTRRIRKRKKKAARKQRKWGKKAGQGRKKGRKGAKKKRKRNKRKKKRKWRGKTVYVSAYERRYPKRKKLDPNTVYNQETRVTTRVTVRKRKDGKPPTALYAKRDGGSAAKSGKKVAGKARGAKKPATKARKKEAAKAEKHKPAPAPKADKKRSAAKEQPKKGSGTSYSVEASRHVRGKRYFKGGHRRRKSSKSRDRGIGDSKERSKGGSSSGATTLGAPLIAAWKGPKSSDPSSGSKSSTNETPLLVHKKGRHHEKRSHKGTLKERSKSTGTKPHRRRRHKSRWTIKPRSKQASSKYFQPTRGNRGRRRKSQEPKGSSPAWSGGGKSKSGKRKIAHKRKSKKGRRAKSSASSAGRGHHKEAAKADLAAKKLEKQRYLQKALRKGAQPFKKNARGLLNQSRVAAKVKSRRGLLGSGRKPRSQANLKPQKPVLVLHEDKSAQFHGTHPNALAVDMGALSSMAAPNETWKISIGGHKHYTRSQGHRKHGHHKHGHKRHHAQQHYEKHMRSTSSTNSTQEKQT